MTMPDFKQWAYNVTIRLNTQERTQDRIEDALRQAFEQGYQLGLNRGWSIEQDKDYVNKEGGKA